MELQNFYKDKKVFITGHSGFKGSWMCKVLDHLGAEVIGYSLEPEPNTLFRLINLNNTKSVFSDIRHEEDLKNAVLKVNPDIFIHMAAQPIVRESYNKPVYTYQTNVMGTIYMLEAVRCCSSIRSVINVTTDKVYKNNEWNWGYRENENLNGFDPYSNSKSCSDIITQCYRNSFIKNIPISICRAGNVIGGGDFASDRIIPDCFRSVQNHKKIELRNPSSIRPYQHVLEPVFAYLYIAMRQWENYSLASEYNIGPENKDCVTTGEIASLFCKEWGNNSQWVYKSETDAVHEANFLKLDCSKAASVLDWNPCWNIKTAIEKTVSWYQGYDKGEDINEIMEEQIKLYLIHSGL